MDTSNSSSGKPGWKVGVLAFSGRRDPDWPISEALASQLEELWRKLPASSKPVSSPPGLGYRGCYLEDPRGRRWYAYGGVVFLTGAKGGPEIREDPSRAFEKMVLRTAPEGLLPPGIMDKF